MKPIIVAVDYSEPSFNAAVYAAQMAAFYNAELWICHVYALPVAPGEISIPVYDLLETQQEANTALAQFCSNVNEQLKVPIPINQKAEMGLLLNNLEEWCQQLQPAMVVMGITGKNALTRFLIGSNTLQAIAQLAFPILVVPPGATFVPVQHVGVATDFNATIQPTALALITSTVTQLRAGLHVIHVEKTQQPVTANMLQQNVQLQHFWEKLSPAFHYISDQNVTHGIAVLAGRIPLDWVIMIPRHHNLLEKIFAHSFTQDFLYHTQLPLLCVPN